MTRLTKQDAEVNVDRMDHQTTEEAFARQANKGILADKVAQELNVPRRTAARVLDAAERRRILDRRIASWSNVTFRGSP